MTSQLRHAVVLLAAAVAAGVLGCDKESPTEPTPPPACTVTVSPSSQTFSGEGGTGTVTVGTSAASCAWTAVASATWIAILEGATGTGPGTVRYSIASNSATAARAGALTIGGQVHAIAQQGQTPTACTYDISPTTGSFGTDGGSGSFTVTAPAGCEWSATSSAAWVVVTAGAQGSGDRTVSFTVDRNSGTAGRSAAIAVADKVYGLNQQGQAPTVCSYAMSPASGSFSSDGGSGSFSVTAPTDCQWSAASSATWVKVTVGGQGTGNGAVSYTVERNSGTTERSAAIAVADKVYSIHQQGQAPTVCTYAISPASGSFSSDGGSGSFSVTAPADCQWSAASSAPWVKVTAVGQGSGNGAVSYTVEPNSGTAARSAAIAVADKSYSITQSGAALLCEYSVAPVQFNPCMPSGTLTATITTQASCPWTASPNVSWLTVPIQSGTGSGNLSIVYSSNYDAPREGLVMVRWPTPTAGQNLRVSQAGCHYAVTKTAFTFGATGGSGTFDVLQESDPNTCGGALQDACLWTATSDVPWIAITSSMPRSGDNPVSFTVAPNTGASVRSGTITVRDQQVRITQAGS